MIDLHVAGESAAPAVRGTSGVVAVAAIAVTSELRLIISISSDGPIANRLARSLRECAEYGLDRPRREGPRHGGPIGCDIRPRSFDGR
jgi:hypothetical protein